MLNVVHHTPKQLKEVLPSITTKMDSLHKVPMAIVMPYTVLRYPISVEVHIGRPSALEVCWIKIIHLHLLKMNKEGSGLAHWVRNNGRIAPSFKYNIGVPSASNGPKNKHYISFQQRNKEGRWTQK